jgi:hypothetical protein
MFWNRIFQGLFGLFLAFSAGEQLQLWIDEGKVWYRSKGHAPRLLSYDETPFSYVSQISFYILCVMGGLWLVWLALGDGAKKSS